MESVAQRLKRYREQAGISSGAELSRLSRVPEATYRAYESGRRPLTARAAKELAVPLGITWQTLLFGQDEAQGAVATAEEASALLGQRVSRRLPAHRHGLPDLSSAEIVVMGGDSWALLPLHDAHLAARPGQPMSPGTVTHRVAFREAWVRSISSAPIAELAVIAIDGNAMAPTLQHGDQVLVDMSQHRPEQREGIYVIRAHGGLQVKRLQVEVGTGRLTIHADNKAYESQRNIKLSAVQIVGRVIWLGRQVTS